jgi:hypothetical protein
MDPCELFLMGDSLSFEDSDLENLLDDDIEQMSIILAAKEIMDVRPKKLQGSTMGRICIPLNHARGNYAHERLFRRGTHISASSLSPLVTYASIFVQQDR